MLCGVVNGAWHGVCLIVQAFSHFGCVNALAWTKSKKCLYEVKDALPSVSRSFILQKLTDYLIEKYSNLRFLLEKLPGRLYELSDRCVGTPG